VGKGCIGLPADNSGRKLIGTSQLRETKPEKEKIGFH